MQLEAGKGKLSQGKVSGFDGANNTGVPKNACSLSLQRRRLRQTLASQQRDTAKADYSVIRAGFGAVNYLRRHVSCRWAPMLCLWPGADLVFGAPNTFKISSSLWQANEAGQSAGSD